MNRGFDETRTKWSLKTCSFFRIKWTSLSLWAPFKVGGQVRKIVTSWEATSERRLARVRILQGVKFFPKGWWSAMSMFSKDLYVRLSTGSRMLIFSSVYRFRITRSSARVSRFSRIKRHLSFKHWKERGSRWNKIRA